MFETLAANEINIDMISTSTIRISCVVAEADAERAVMVLHKRFGLGQGDDAVEFGGRGHQPTPAGKPGWAPAVHGLAWGP